MSADFTELSKKEAIEFGEWLLRQGCVISEADDAWKASANIDILQEVYDTSVGEWLTMEQLYNKWLLIDSGE